MRRTLLTGFIVGLTLWTGGAGYGQPGPSGSAPALDLPGYAAELTRWSSAVGRLPAHPDEAAALRKELPDHWSVLVEEQDFSVPTHSLGAALDRLAANPKIAAETSVEMTTRLRAMLADAQDLAHTAGRHSTGARARLSEILHRREFHSVQLPDQEESFWDRIVDWCFTLLMRIFSRVGGHPRVTRGLLWTVVVALGLVFLAWLVYSLANLSLAGVFSGPRPNVGKDGEAAGDWAAWREEARTAASRGDYRNAVRIVYGAAIRSLEAKGVWKVDPARTHREYVRLLPVDSAQHFRMTVIAASFERVWYGRTNASAAEYEAVLGELESMV